MLLPCEVGIKTVLPAIRALMARAIIEKHGMKEKQVAEILGLSQSAVSRYITKGRGNILPIETIPEVQKLIEKMITLSVYEPHRRMEILKLFCATCEIVRKKGLMCHICRKEMPKKWSESCTFCHSA